MCIGCELSQQLSSCFSQAVLARAGTTSRRRVLQAGALMAASAVTPSLLNSRAQAAPADGKANWLFEGGYSRPPLKIFNVKKRHIGPDTHADTDR